MSPRGRNTCLVFAALGADFAARTQTLKARIGQSWCQNRTLFSTVRHARARQKTPRTPPEATRRPPGGSSPPAGRRAARRPPRGAAEAKPSREGLPRATPGLLPKPWWKMFYHGFGSVTKKSFLNWMVFLWFYWYIVWHIKICLVTLPKNRINKYFTNGFGSYFAKVTFW